MNPIDDVAAIRTAEQRSQTLNVDDLFGVQAMHVYQDLSVATKSR